MSGKKSRRFSRKARRSAAEARELRISYMPHTFHDIELCDRDISNTKYIQACHPLWFRSYIYAAAGSRKQNIRSRKESHQILVSMRSRKNAETKVSNFSRVRNVLHGGCVVGVFAEAVHTSNQIRRNKNHHSGGVCRSRHLRGHPKSIRVYIQKKRCFEHCPCLPLLFVVLWTLLCHIPTLELPKRPKTQQIELWILAGHVSSTACGRTKMTQDISRFEAQKQDSPQSPRTL